MSLRIIVLALLGLFIGGCVAGNTKSNISEKGVGEVFVAPEVNAAVEVVIASDGIVSVSQVSTGENGIEFSLSKMGSGGMMLSAKSSLDVVIKYDIEMIDNNGKRYYTSSCPLMPKAGAFESWGHNIPKLRISNFRILKESEALVCQ
ncbi:hypothetical protein KO528_07465 [Saccharophagus degradans]|uniref:hypothetical protein n=1 Tax=Saccharophagus degradans TaxID=86304 RepID=UPI001C0A514D|nr:hypothetical protein [Saccharophagus degradans]MBU2985184.1 hypothetical protein [Saccharophagus degradans]